MKIEYILIQHNLFEKRNDETAPIYSIKLINTETQPYTMSTQLKDFSIAMQKYGLTWSEKYNEYIIPDDICLNQNRRNNFLNLIQETIERYNKGENIITQEEQERENTQSYYTKKYAITYLQDFINHHINPSQNNIILDPSAGEGRLIDGLNISKNFIWAIEPNQECCNILKQKGYKNVINTTFQTAIAKRLIPTPTHIIMNPPFSKQQDITFYNLACRLLKDNGIISAIISKNSIYEELKKYDFNLDDTLPIKQAKEILKMQQANHLSSQMLEFLNNIANSKNLFIDNVTSEFSFENTQARAFYFRGIVKQKQQTNQTTHNQPKQDEER